MQKRSLSRQEAADHLSALADALREGGDAELDLDPGTQGLRILDDLHSEMEVEIGEGEIELEIELKWPTAPARATPPRADARAEETPGKMAPTPADRSRGAKRCATKTPRADARAGREKTSKGPTASGGALRHRAR
ncbi:amphi-Trp domain-containing protein [Streptomyces sp. D2-8]|uniref:amphi-Trp domain-containing protein n=1 Tax=Streptomyces sp. D2-8 TaxID=2707767 RepID=UPI0020C109CE|nr:amphi-Trp domain-containing protein [Streptomyces sp. D2-8]MCK8433955.1 amphi-Trp domain-containing protein [Streptomyces sp. D2-8]